MSENIVIFGSSGHAKVIVDIVEKEGKFKIVGFLDPKLKIGDKIFGYSFIGRDQDLPSLMNRYSIHGGIIAIGDNQMRFELSKKIENLVPNFNFIRAVHPRAIMAREVGIGEGTVVMAGAVINPYCSIGRFCILNTQSSFDHDSTMADFSSLAPGVVTGGNVQIKEFSAIGIGAILLDGIRIGEHTVIGAGATVVKDIDAYCIAYGTPAGVKKKRKAGEKYL